MLTNKIKSNSLNINVIDLFCGIGGLSYGLKQSGLNILAGIDNDSSCEFGYEANIKADFFDSDISEVSSDFIKKLFKSNDTDKSISVLVGCAPCQPFSKLNLKKKDENKSIPLEEFGRIIQDVLPDIVSMENVRGLANKKKYPEFAKFIKILEDNDYQISYKIVDASKYGVPQKRFRLVLLASRLGEIKLVPITHPDNPITVKDTISHLSPIKAGETDKVDTLHKSRKLSEKNLQRIQATPHDGGNSSSWPEELLLKCHKKESGKSFSGNVYARMWWDKPSPTITTQCQGIGNGRFGHPEQNRAISLREAALLQTFPENYVFSNPNEPIYFSRTAKFIGNAVPVQLAKIIGESIKKHVEEHTRQR